MIPLAKDILSLKGGLTRAPLLFKSHSSEHFRLEMGSVFRELRKCLFSPIFSVKERYSSARGQPKRRLLELALRCVTWLLSECLTST